LIYFITGRCATALECVEDAFFKRQKPWLFGWWLLTFFKDWLWFFLGRVFFAILNLLEQVLDPNFG
jgi:hypothetical protein